MVLLVGENVRKFCLVVRFALCSLAAVSSRYQFSIIFALRALPFSFIAIFSSPISVP